MKCIVLRVLQLLKKKRKYVQNVVLGKKPLRILQEI